MGFVLEGHVFEVLGLYFPGCRGGAGGSLRRVGHSRAVRDRMTRQYKGVKRGGRAEGGCKGDVFIKFYAGGWVGAGVWEKKSKKDGGGGDESRFRRFRCGG